MFLEGLALLLREFVANVTLNDLFVIDLGMHHNQVILHLLCVSIFFGAVARSKRQ